MSSILIKNAGIVNEGKRFVSDILIVDDRIVSVGSSDEFKKPHGCEIINAAGLLVIPGVIDDQVHFREPGLTHKGDIYTESRAAAAGGITSFMDMPNTVPQAITIENLNEKYRLGSEKSFINYSFAIGASNNNFDEIMKVDPSLVCGIKIFLGSSTGDMLVDNDSSVRRLFRYATMPISAHCEDEPTIRKNSAEYLARYGQDVPFSAHPLIRSREACFISSSGAANIAREYNTRLHLFHLSTADEMKLLDNNIPLEHKRITGEVCIHHLWFDDSDYHEKGAMIKWNPAIKTRFDRDALRDGVRNGLLDVIASDHAPHTLEEKSEKYFKAPSGGPLVQHSLPAMLELWHNNIFSIETIVEKMCHNPAILFNIKDRGFIREGYKADLCLVNPDDPWQVSKENIYYKCGWSPFEGTTFRSKVTTTIVNGNVVYNKGIFNEDYRGERLLFDR